MQDCNGLTNAFVETDMADMEGLRKQVAIHRAMTIVMRCVVVIWLILCTLYANAHVPHLEILIKFGEYSIFYLYKHCSNNA